jgi:uncharacterized RDD family membrane protein YckC
LILFSGAIAYFSLVNSHLTGGRSLGKRATGLHVVDSLGRPISLVRSFVRTTILWLPLAVFASDLRFMTDCGIDVPGATFFYSVLLVGVGGAGFYFLMLTMMKSGRTLHDQVASTFVVRLGAQPVPPHIWAGHKWVVAALFATSLALPLVKLNWFETWEPARTIAFYIKLQSALADDRSMVLRGYESDSRGAYSASRGWVMSSLLHLSVHVYGDKPDLRAPMKKVLLKLVEVNPDAMSYSYLSIDATHGGAFFTGQSNAKGCYGTPQQWREKGGDCPNEGFLRIRDD